MKTTTKSFRRAQCARQAFRPASTSQQSARPSTLALRRAARGERQQARAASAQVLEQQNEQVTKKRLQFLEEQAVEALHTSASSFEHPVFPCALIAGDVVILHLLHKAGLFDKVKVVFIDTLHLFDETVQFLRDVESRYGFKALYYTPEQFPNREEFMKVHGVDLPIRDIEEYDRICKVEPFQRSLSEQQCDIMINGRRRDHGAERAHLRVFEAGGTGVANCQPLAYWEFKDCFDYAEQEGVQLHPLHEQGYPSVGDMHSTLPVPKERWFEYSAERSGRFQGLTNADGSDKTECGIHTIASGVGEGALASSLPALETEDETRTLELGEVQG